MEFTLRSGGHGRPLLHGVLISAAVYIVFDKSAVRMDVELGVAVRDRHVMRVLENRVPMVFYLSDDAVGSSDDIVSHGRELSEK
jgi:hypothetical protein